MSNKWLYPVYGIIQLIVAARYFCLRKLKKKQTKHLYIYSDSRGFNVNRWYCKKNPVDSYIANLARKYKVSYSICQYKHTTLIDFLYDLSRTNVDTYDFIILHAGVVDFSPRPINQARAIIQKKAARITELFGTSALQDFTPASYPEKYEGEETASLYSVDVLKKYILPAINELAEKIIWIGINPVILGWCGNYSRPRPVNINNVLLYQKIVDEQFCGMNITLANLTEAEIRALTVDNIHLSERGMSEMVRRLTFLMDRKKNA